MIMVSSEGRKDRGGKKNFLKNWHDYKKFSKI